MTRLTKAQTKRANDSEALFYIIWLEALPFDHNTPRLQTDRQDRQTDRRTVFGRPFVKRFALCYRSVVCPVCLSCPVCDVRPLWPNGWTIKMKLGMQVGLSPGHIVLGGDRAPTPLKGHSPLPIFWPMYVAAKWLHGSRCHLVWS